MIYLSIFYRCQSYKIKKKIVSIIYFHPDLCIKNKILIGKYNNCYILFHSDVLKGDFYRILFYVHY